MRPHFSHTRIANGRYSASGCVTSRAVVVTTLPTELWNGSPISVISCLLNLSISVRSCPPHMGHVLPCIAALRASKTSLCLLSVIEGFYQAAHKESVRLCGPYAVHPTRSRPLSCLSRATKSNRLTIICPKKPFSASWAEMTSGIKSCSQTPYVSGLRVSPACSLRYLISPRGRLPTYLAGTQADIGADFYEAEDAGAEGRSRMT